MKQIKPISAGSSAAQKICDMLVNGTYTVKNLDYEKSTHRLGFYQYVKDHKPSILSNLTGEQEKLFLDSCLTMDPLLFVYLTPSQYTDERVEKYLVERLKKTDAPADFQVKSYDHRLVFKTTYSTCEGEQIFYYDNDLKTQLFLVAKVQVSFKCTDPLQLLKKLDLDVRYLGYNNLNGTILEWINEAYRRVILGVVGEGKSGIYQLNVRHEELEKAIAEELTTVFAKDSGLFVEKVSIKKLSLVDETAKLLEKHGLEYLIEQRRQDLEIEYEKEALANYEKKAEIHNAHPQFTPTLTEAEKDFALNRYIRKSKFERGEEEEVAVAKLKGRQAGTDEVIKKKGDVPMRKKIKPFFIALFVFAIVFLIVAFHDPDDMEIGAALIFAGLSALCIGLGVFFGMGWREKTKKTNASDEEYAAQLQEIGLIEKNGGME